MCLKGYSKELRVCSKQWTESIIVVQVFSLALILNMLTSGLASGNVLYAVNKPDTAFYVDVVTDGIYFLGLVLFASLGMHAILVMDSSYIAVKAVAMLFPVWSFVAIAYT